MPPLAAAAYRTSTSYGIGGTITLKNSVITGNQATVGPEIANDTRCSIVTVNNFNLFGANGNAGVSGFTPGPTDIVPRNVPLAQILGPLKVVQPRPML